MITHSAGERSLPFFRISSGTAILPRSCRYPPRFRAMMESSSMPRWRPKSAARTDRRSMAFGIGIAAFDDQAQGAENGVGGLQLVGEFLQTEQRFHAGDQFLSENRLVEEIVGASLDAVHFVAAIAESGDEHERNQARGRVFL